jgi:hypothetical protein
MVSSKSQFVHASEIVRVEYSAWTRADRQTVWKIFSDWRRWQRFSDCYGEVDWLSGTPWMVGSRLRIEMVRPIRMRVDHVITVCSPGECVAWIDHFMGNTMEQWVVFERRPEGGTSVKTWAEVAGLGTIGGGRQVRSLIKSFIELWYSRFCRECDRIHQKACEAVLN